MLDDRNKGSENDEDTRLNQLEQDEDDEQDDRLGPPDHVLDHGEL
jgi:hypothetical protein